MRWHTKPITQLVVMFVVMSMVIGAQSTASAFLTGNTKNKTVSKIQDTGLRKVAGTIADPTCPNTDAVQYAMTENNLAIAPPSRMRYVDAPWEYDSLNTTYFARTQEFDQAGFGTKAQNIAFMADDPNDDSRVSSIMSSMFRYKPTALKNAYILKYTPAVVRDDPSPYKGDAPAIEVPSKAGWPVCVPTTGYDIGGGYEAMVVSAESNRITLHIGIHEYMDGDQPALGGCPLGQRNCRGGYWLYISGIAVDSDILSAYNGKKGIQQGSGLSRNIIDRIQLPIVKPGRRLGISQGDGVTVLLRDSGPIIYANKNFMWGGGFPEYDPGGTPTNTPAAGTPTAPPASTPTTAPTAPPAGQQCFTLSAEIFADRVGTGTYTFQPHIKVFSPVGGKDGDIMASFLDGSTWINNSTFIPWNKGTHNPKDIEYNRVSNRSVRTFPNALNLDELTDSYKIKIDNCSPLPNESTIQCKMGIRDGNPFVEGIGGSDCRCMGSSCTALPPTTAPTNTPVPPGTTTSPTVPPGTSPTAVPTLPPGTTPTVSPTGPVTNLPGQNVIRVTVSSSCNEPACADIRVLISHIDAERLEGSFSYLHWQLTNNQWGNSGTSAFTSGFSTSDQFFTFQAPQFDLSTLVNVKKLVLQAELTNPREQRFYVLINRP